MRTNHISRRKVILTIAIVILLFEVTACTSDVTDETGSVVTSLYDNGDYQNNGDSEISDGYYTGILHVDT